MNIYDEENPRQTSGGILLEVDFSKNQTLHQLISSVKNYLDSISDETDVTLFLVGGQQLNENNYDDFFHYLSTNFKPSSNHSVYIRGYFDLELVKLLLIYNCNISTNCKVVYSAVKLNKILNAIKDTPALLNKFIQRYTTQYHQFELAYLPLNELTLLGFNYETF